MISIPWILGSQLQCGESLPTGGLFLFTGTASVAVLLEIWVANQFKRGRSLVNDEPLALSFAAAMSFLGRFDAYSDITFAVIIHDCAETGHDITWISMGKAVIHTPFGISLWKISFFLIAVGVFCLQVIPGYYSMLRKSNFPIAFKLLEFNVLLKLMEPEHASTG